MRKKILNTSRVVLVVGLGIALFFTSFLLEMKLTREAQTGLVNLVSTLVQQVDFQGDLQKEANQIANSTEGLRVTFISPAGYVLADSATRELPVENHLDRAEIKQARVAGVGIDTRASETLGGRMMYAAAEAPNGTFIRLSREYEFFWHGMFSFLPAILGAGFIAFLLAIPLSNHFAKGILKPIAEFSASLHQKKQIDQNGNYPYEELRGVAIEISQLQQEVYQREQETAGENRKIEAILQNMREGFILLNHQQNILLINQAACEILQCSRLVGERSLLHATQNVILLEAVDRVLKNRESETVEFQTSSNWYEASIGIVQDVNADGQDDVVVLLSGTSEKRDNARTRQQFFEAASHELKTPITSIRGFAELLNGDIPVPEQQKQDCIARILKESKRMQSLINDIIMISRMESGTIHFETERINLQEIVDEYSEVARQLGAENNITVTCQSQPIFISAARRQMEELIGNLVTNAVKYNYPNGKIEIVLFYKGAVPVFRVFNTGEAIPLTKTKRIFERFYRMDKGRSKDAGGTGLGLAIVKHVANQCGATVSVYPEEGVGNTFEIVFTDFVEKEQAQSE